MGHLQENLLELMAARTEHAELVTTKLELEREARAGSKETARRARQLLTSSTLAMLQRNNSITAISLMQEISVSADAQDRYAVELCRDWLNFANQR